VKAYINNVIMIFAFYFSATLIFTVIGANGLTSIQGKESNLYLCMTKKGKLRARVSVNSYLKFNWIF